MVVSEIPLVPAVEKKEKPLVVEDPSIPWTERP